MNEPKTVRVKLVSPFFRRRLIFGYGDEAKMELTGWREMRDGREQEYRIELVLSPEDLACVLNTCRHTVREMATEMRQRIANVEARL